MKTVTVKADAKDKGEILAWIVRAGRVQLSAEQAKDRAHNLKAILVDRKTGDGVYEVLAPIQFKRGEQFSYEGELVTLAQSMRAAAREFNVIRKLREKEIWDVRQSI